MPKDRRIIVLGCGGVGSVVIRHLSKNVDYSRLIIADKEIDKAKRLVSELGYANIAAEYVDVDDHISLAQLMKKGDVIINLIRPLAKYAPKIARIAIESKVNYLDACDNWEATQEILALNKSAADAGVTILTCLGMSPGLTNILARYGADKLDEIEEIHTAWVSYILRGTFESHHHRFQVYSGGSIYRDGMWISVPAFSDKETIEIPGPYGKADVYTAAHPEALTIPHFIKGVKVVTIKGGYLPIWHTEFLRNVVNYGFTSAEQINVQDALVAPIDFLSAFMASDAGAKAMKYGEGIEKFAACSVTVLGKKGGKAARYTYGAYDRDYYPSIAVPLSIAAKMMFDGDIPTKGVIAPEAINPNPILNALIAAGVVFKGLE